LATPAAAEQLTSRCERDSYYFFTFDTATGRMASETIGGGSYRGEIKSVSDTEIVFTQFVTSNATLHYLRNEGAIEVRADKVFRTLVNCVPAPTRDILSKWENLL
jgi:ethanolamine ammonia-lyase large subunit